MKYYISKDSTKYLSLQSKEIPKYSMPYLLINLLDTIKSQNMLLLKKYLISGIAQENFISYEQNMKNDQYIEQSINTWYKYEVMAINKISYLEELDVKYLSGTKTIKKENYQYQNIKNINTLIDNIISEIPKTSIKIGYNQIDPKFFIEEFKDLKEFINKLELPEINLANYSLKDCVKTNIFDINNNKYYCVVGEEFITLGKTRHKIPKFVWSLSKNIDDAFLFNGNLANYNLLWSEKEINKVYIKIEFSKIDKKTESKLINEIGIEVEKLNIDKHLKNYLSVDNTKIEVDQSKTKRNKL